jgi:diguanylate cyclase (GGDEF)-like protein/PAS domain S-box-containing protein
MKHNSERVSRKRLENTPFRARQLEGREWWLWGFAVTVTLVLTLGIASLTFSGPHLLNSSEWFDLKEWVRGLACLVLLFDIYSVYQQLQLHRMRRELADGNQLFQLITENAADMIAVVDGEGHRLYNSPAYQKVLGYSNEELSSGSSIDQVHPSDRERVLRAAQRARVTGKGQTLEYRMRDKQGAWHDLESTASPVPNAGGKVDRLVIVNRDVTERKRAEEMLAHNALHDSLTGLPNRNLFLDRLQHALTRARRHADYKIAVLFVDVDEFKVVNDSLGHAAGNELISQMSQRLSGSFRETDTLARPASVEAEVLLNPHGLARMGGDEFTVLIEDVGSPSDAIRVAQRIQKKLAIPFEISGQKLVIATSVGVALSDNSYIQAADLMRDAEIAMYRAKQGGKARCEVFDPGMHSSAVRRLKLETDLRLGMERGELLVYYQPIVSLASGLIVGFEALSRWQRPDGMVSPAEFIPVADETGLILPINRSLLLEACQQLRSWQTEFPCDPPLTMSVNITPRQFALPDLAKEIGVILETTGVAASTLHLEIMETIAMGNADRALDVLSELKGLGVCLSIDDFGIGYSSLSRLPKFPVDALKIDRVFISNMHHDRGSFEIVRLIIMLAHSVGLKVVAEGTETEEQIWELKQLGCEMAQGYLYSPPTDANTASELLSRSLQPALSQ